MIKSSYFFPAGPFLLAIAILMNRFLPESAIIDFLEGLFTGLSLVLNFGYMLNYRKKQIHLID